ncbi:WhiB family transcriptional regulator [Streptomyces sp. MRC013]|uniref:WhiB family transcriptional regulator n=1 Tax=Streptomyces sp. MRC013 TaxID=2898276 RepID=UPI0020274D84|nr:WhiB family transcriptional regulator [Streptomyces sp. MRC013]URM92562.1 WhiB family transcriptional regulator [Streptomyces sp. MRC013]
MFRMPTYSIEDRTAPRSPLRPVQADAPSWQETALCAQTGPELFFPEPGSSTREAKFLCGMCEIREACLEYALTHDERFGVWGGLSEQERYALRRRAGRR